MYSLCMYTCLFTILYMMTHLCMFKGAESSSQRIIEDCSYKTWDSITALKFDEIKVRNNAIHIICARLVISNCKGKKESLVWKVSAWALVQDTFYWHTEILRVYTCTVHVHVLVGYMRLVDVDNHMDIFMWDGVLQMLPTLDIIDLKSEINHCQLFTFAIIHKVTLPPSINKNSYIGKCV